MSKLEKITFNPGTEESVEFFVLEQTRIGGYNYILVTDFEDGDGEALILKDLSKDGEEESVPKVKKAFWLILIMAVSLFLVTYFKTLSAKFLDSAILYPIYQGSCLILSSLMCAIFFGEKLTGKCIIKIGTEN